MPVVEYYRREGKVIDVSGLCLLDAKYAYAKQPDCGFL